MARSITTIYDEMILEKNQLNELNALQPNIESSQTLLNDLTTQSKVGVWRLLFFVMAVAIWIHEKLFDLHKSEIEAKSLAIISGTARWYRDQCFLFQIGDTLVWLNNKFQYPSINTANQIIKRAAVIEAAGQVRIKVAKLGNNNLPEPLTFAELTAFQSYIAKIKFAGTNVAIISKPADLLKISYDVHYDPLILDELGQLISDPTIKPVENAINNYIQNLPFNGILNLTSLTDAIQHASGVIDPVLLSAEAKYGSIPYAPIVKNYNADAGHMRIDPAFPLTNTINYIANV